ncbi:D-alanyl-D-alanine carboxypeptidase [Spirillospora sp. NPDC127200]
MPPEEKPAVPEGAEPIPERALPTLDPNGQWTAQWRSSEPQQAAPPARPTAEDPAYAPHDIAPFAQPEAPPHVQPTADGQYEPEPAEGGKRGRKVLITLVAALVLVAGVVTGQLLRPVPEPSIELSLPAASHTFPGAAPALPWPSGGQSAVAVEGLGTMGSAGGSQPIPTASVAKVMTAYVILRGHPLRPGEDGPEFAVSPQGLAELPGRRARQESLLGITPGQRLTERKALEALMIISANDVAHELARWDSGGNVQAFVAKMNEAARSLGMASTTYTDPSGYHAGTVSTAADQVKLLTAAMKIPAFAETVGKRSYVPADGGPPRPGGNILLGQYGVVGGKTGYTDRAGGNFVFAARKRVGGVPTTVVGAVMGQRTPGAPGSAMVAINAAQRVVAAAGNALVSATLAPAGRPIAHVDDGLGGKTPLVARTPLNVVGWPGLTVPLGVAGDPPHEAAPGERVGTVTAGAGRVPVSPSEPLEEPSLLSRLVRLG